MAVNYHNFVGRLIKLNREYPIYSRDLNSPDTVIGHTCYGDMAVITFGDLKVDAHGNVDGYFEIVITSGKYAGVDTVALDLEDLDDITFIFNKVDGAHKWVTIQDIRVKYEYAS